MKFHELALKAHTKVTRVGRGISAGGGKTAGRGTKGQKARTGKKLKPGFEGGQTKLSMRLPKVRGFKHTGISYQLVRLAQLDAAGLKKVDATSLKELGLIKYVDRPVKLVGPGTPKDALTIEVQASSHPALKAVEKAGGAVKIVALGSKATQKSDKTVEKDVK